MKIFFLALAASSLLCASCSKESIRGSGATRTESRTVGNFTNVELSDNAEVTIHYGVAYTVTLTGYENLLPVYEASTTNNTLYLQFKPGVYNVRNNNIKVAITLPALAGMRINGSGKMTAHNFVNTTLAAAINGSGYLFIDNSQYAKVNYVITGSGQIAAAGTTAQEAEVHISGSGNIELSVSKQLKATVSGSGNILYWGNPGTTDTQVSGSGKITKK